EDGGRETENGQGFVPHRSSSVVRPWLGFRGGLQEHRTRRRSGGQERSGSRSVRRWDGGSADERGGDRTGLAGGARTDHGGRMGAALRTRARAPERHGSHAGRRTYDGVAPN